MADTKFAEQLTPMDLLMPPGYIGAVLIFKTTQPPSNLINALQASLSTLCDKLPWIKGSLFPTLRMRDQKPSLEVRWSASNDPPQIVDKGLIPETYEYLSKARFPAESIATHLWPAPAPREAGAPVFATSVFRFADEKAIGLCIQGHHRVIDGFAFAEITNLWAHFTKNAESPDLNTQSLPGRVSALTKAINKNPELVSAVAALSVKEIFKRHPEYSNAPPGMPTEFLDCRSEIISIPIKKIETLKDKLRRHLSKPPTTNTVACALIWAAVTRARARRMPEFTDKASRLPMAVNGRKRLDPSLTDRASPFLGNMVLFSLSEMPVRDLIAAGNHNAIEVLAMVCQLLTSAQSTEHVGKAHIIEVYNLVQAVEDYQGIFPGWALFGSCDLFITSWADLDLYRQDFGIGLGQPQFVRIPYAQGDGNAIILPRRMETTSPLSLQDLEVVVMLQKEDLDRVKEDAIWENL